MLLNISKPSQISPWLKCNPTCYHLNVLHRGTFTNRKHAHVTYPHCGSHVTYLHCGSHVTYPHYGSHVTYPHCGSHVFSIFLGNYRNVFCEIEINATLFLSTGSSLLEKTFFCQDFEIKRIIIYILVSEEIE